MFTTRMTINGFKIALIVALLGSAVLIPVSDVSPVAPLNSAWRFGIGAQHQVSERFYWGVSAEYLYGGTLDVDKQSILPVNLGGRGDVDGSYDDTGAIIAGLYGSWKF
jgi:hypothetical protein